MRDPERVDQADQQAAAVRAKSSPAELVLARDPLAVEQFYYRRDADGHRIRFGSMVRGRHGSGVDQFRDLTRGSSTTR